MKTFGQQRLIDEKQRLEKKLEEKEKQLCEQKEKYRTLVENAIAGIGITDLKENVIFVNETFAHMLGYSKEELCGVNLAALTDRNTFSNQKSFIQCIKIYSAAWKNMDQ